MHGNAAKSTKIGKIGQKIGTKLAPKMNRHAG
jgi:hypothetical protein